MGLDRFIWWIGVIVNREDALKAGRCQLRIFGWHTGNKQMLPDADLPWALPLYPINSSKSFESPKVGDWVFGFFMDGENAQFPVYTGVFKSIVPLAVEDDDGFNPQQETGAPKLPDGVFGPQPGQSDIALTAQGQIANTGIAKSDADLIHICDVTAKVNFDIAKQKLKQLIDVSAIRAAVKAEFAGTSASPMAQNVKDLAKQAKQTVKLIKQYTDAIKEEVKALEEYKKYIEDTIKMIESLPAEARKLFEGCLKELKQSLSDITKD